MRVDRWRDDVVPFPKESIERFRAAGYWTGRTIGESFHLVATSNPDGPAVITAGTTLTFRELDERTDQIAATLAGLGLQPGDAVLFQLANTVSTVLAWYGVIKAGLIPVATLVDHRGHEIHEIGTLTDAAAHVVQADYARADLVDMARRMAARGGRERTILTVGARAPGEGVARLEDLGLDVDPAEARAVVERIAKGIDGDDIAVFQLSGGTTATPKVIPRLHDDYWYNSVAYTRRMGWDSSVRVAQIMPIIHNAGIVLGLHAPHAVGGALVLADPNPDRLLPLMASSETTDVLAYPALAFEWRDHPEFERATGSLKRLVFSGTRVNDATFRLFDSRGIRVLGLYGCGEGLVTVTDLNAPAEVRQHSVGTPLSDLDDVRILDPGTENPTPDETPGELCFAGPYTLRGYLRSPERNAEAFTSDGLYRSGDLVAMRTIAGVRCLTFEGRAKDLVNRGGEKVNAGEIEALAVQITGVARVALIAVPDKRLGERGCLCVELLPGAGPLQLSDVTDFLRQREVAKFKWPELLEVLDSLPQTRVGKIDKQALVTRVVENLARSATGAKR
jgi:non-ribosomal peptide synthetase component E (peptide arylation enzyme)